ncbi:MAG: class I adenylate-forming enzyme family protein [Micrococcales bacterium]
MQINESIRQPHEWLAHWALVSPNAPMFRDGLQEMSYQQAYEYARKLAQKLRGLGLARGQLVSLELPTGLQVLFMCALLGEGITSQLYSESSNQKADALFSASRTNSQVADRTLLVDSEFLRSLDSEIPIEEFAGFAEDSIVRLVYSSGTTGVPKPIALKLNMVHHRSIAAVELSNANEPFLSMLDLSTASGFHTFVGSLMTGACYYNPGDGSHNLGLIDKFKITSVKASPSQLSELVKAAEAGQQELPSLKTVFSAGSAMPELLLTKLKALTAAKVFTLYGSSEAGRCAQRELTDGNSSNVGHVVEGTELRIVDEKHNEQDPSKPGMVQYRRAHQATEYFNDRSATDQVFDEGWFNTGDLGYLNENQELIILGRVGDVVNVGGVKVSLTELELFAQNQKTVGDAAAFTATDENENQQLALAVETGADLSHLIEALKHRFGSQSPTVIFELPQIPRNTAGKVMRNELRETFEKAQRS